MVKPWEIDLTVYEDEQALLEGLRRREPVACTCLLKRFGPRMYQLAIRLMGDPDEAEGVLQEALIQACRRIEDFEGRSGLGTWLHRIVTNTALMRLRRRKPVTVDLQEQLQKRAAVPPALVDATTEPSAEVMGAELRAMIDRALADLPDTLRTAFVLREIEGLSTREAAAELGISESALKVRVHRARLALRAALAPYLDDAGADGKEAT